MDAQTSSGFSISGFLKYYAKHWLATIIIMLIALSSGAAFYFLQPQKYVSSAQAIITDSAYPSTIAKDVARTNYIALIKSSQVLSTVESKTELTLSQLVSSLSVVNEKGSDIITIKFTCEQQDQGDLVITEVIKSFQTNIHDIYKVSANGVKVFSRPDSNASQNVAPWKILSIALVSGVATSFIVAFIRFDHQSAKLAKDNIANRQKDEEKARKKEVTARIKLAEASIEEANLRIAKARRALQAKK